MSVPDEIVVEGPRPLRGHMRVQGDKGISHRALLFAALAQGTSRIAGLAPGDDVARTRAALEALGVRVRDDGGALAVQGGGASALREPSAVLDCGNSGTTMRMVLGLVAGRPFHTVLTGDDSLVQRPMGRVTEPLRALGARVDGRAGGDLAPLAVRGGSLEGRVVELSVASGQVKTALVLAGLQASGVTEIREPATSRDHSERLLAALGAPVEQLDARTLRVRAGEPRPFELDVPGDPSVAAFFVVGALVTPGSNLVLDDVALNPGRLGFIETLRRMGAAVEVEPAADRLGEPVGSIAVRTSALTATTIVCDEATIDEIPALSVAAAFADGVTEIHDAAELRVKESDRLATITQELTQLGIGVEARPDGLVIRGGKPAPATLKSHGDHRVAMAGAIAANAIEGRSTVRGWRAVASSHPRFAEDLTALTETRA
jgi:3-phosphoshikimate 1-carboxyvinyltransferase